MGYPFELFFGVLLIHRIAIEAMFGIIHFVESVHIRKYERLQFLDI